MEKVLEDYFEELRWDHYVRNVETLINSHRMMKANLLIECKQNNKKKEDLLKEYKSYFEMIVDNDYVKVEDLMNMTMAEFTEKFGR